MANTNTFRSLVGKLLPKSNAVNAAGAPAYALSAKQALAQYAVTGCFNSIFYASADAVVTTFKKVRHHNSRWPIFLEPVQVGFSSAKSMSKRARYFRRRSASLTLAFSEREAANNSRPAAESERAARQTESTS